MKWSQQAWLVEQDEKGVVRLLLLPKANRVGEIPGGHFPLFVSQRNDHNGTERREKRSPANVTSVDTAYRTRDNACNSKCATKEDPRNSEEFATRIIVETPSVVIARSINGADVERIWKNEAHASVFA